MTKTRWGIIGPGSIAHNFADGLKEAPAGELIAIASRTAARRKAFGDDYGIAAHKRYDNYEAICADPDVDAIYVSTPHPWHAELAIMAMRAGKPVVCEKPAGMTGAEAITLVEVAAQENVFFMEAFMYRCHPQIARVLEIIASGEIGALQHVRVNFGFNAPFNPTSRAYDPMLGGGGILDVGCYPMSFARLIAGAAIGTHVDEPIAIKGVGRIGKSGVDEVAYGVLNFSSGFTAEIATAVAMNMENTALVIGDKGKIELLDPWVPGRNAGPSDASLNVTADGVERQETLKHPEHLFAFEAEVASRAIAAGKREADAPACTHADTIGNNIALDKWRHEVGYKVFTEQPKTNRILPGVLQPGLPNIPEHQIGDISVSSLIMGCDNRETIAEGAIVWDAYMAAGGHTFDTAFVYGAGRHEKVLGEWIKSRGVEKDITLISKGGHTPYCFPNSLAAELDISFDRMGVSYAPIYVMHRDNPNVPVGEFIDALNALKNDGKIGMFGGSNWSIDRFKAANDYAAQNGLEPLRILNNNLSLAVMENAIWPGCITSNSAKSLAYLRNTQTAHFSWSSQARGYFLRQELRDRLPKDIGPDHCFGSSDNQERRKRAETLAEKYGVEAHNIATAWVLAQSFPSLALIGPRSAGELASTLQSLQVTLKSEEIAWLNLE